MTAEPQANTPKPTGLVPVDWRSVHHQLHANAGHAPSRIALQPVDGGEGLSWGGLATHANRIAHWLKSIGVGANDRIAVLGGNSLEHLILYYGIQAYGATYCVVNVEVNQAHLAEMLERMEPGIVLYDETLDSAVPEAGSAGRWIRFGRHDAAPGDGGDELFAMLSAFPDSDDIAPVNGPEDTCVISFTSGTAAAPKGVMHSFCNYYAIAQHVEERWSLTETDRVLEFRSIGWASAHMLSLNPVLLSGATLLFAERFSNSGFFDWIGNHSPTIVIAVPTVVNMLLERAGDDEGIGDDVLAGLRFMSCSTAPLMVEQHRRFEDRYGIPLVQLYGMSEGGVVAANAPSTRRIGSVGTAGRYQNLTIRDGNGDPVAPGAEGEIETVSAQHAYAYLHPGGRLERIRARPLKTGDLGYIDSGGFLHITGRAKDVIIRGGVNIAPLEIDNALMTHPDIEEAATIGVPDPIYGEEVACYIVPRAGRTLEAGQVLDHCAASLPSAKLPKTVIFADEVPHNARGKIDRDALRRDWAAAQVKAGHG